MGYLFRLPVLKDIKQSLFQLNRKLKDEKFIRIRIFSISFNSSFMW